MACGDRTKDARAVVPLSAGARLLGRPVTPQPARVPKKKQISHERKSKTNPEYPRAPTNWELEIQETIDDDKPFASRALKPPTPRRPLWYPPKTSVVVHTFQPSLPRLSVKHAGSGTPCEQRDNCPTLTC